MLDLLAAASYLINFEYKTRQQNTILVDCLFSLDDFDFSVIYTWGNDKSKAVIGGVTVIGVRVGGGGGEGAAPPRRNFGQLSFLGQQEKIWAKPVFKDVSMVI